MCVFFFFFSSSSLLFLVVRCRSRPSMVRSYEQKTEWTMRMKNGRMKKQQQKQQIHTCLRTHTQKTQNKRDREKESKKKTHRKRSVTRYKLYLSISYFSWFVVVYRSCACIKSHFNFIPTSFSSAQMVTHCRHLSISGSLIRVSAASLDAFARVFVCSYVRRDCVRMQCCCFTVNVREQLNSWKRDRLDQSMLCI